MVGYYSRRCIIVGRNPDGFCIIPAGGAIFSGIPIEVGYPTGLGLLVNFRYSSGSDLPMGFRNSTVIQGWIIPAVLIIVVDELSNRSRSPNWIQIILLRLAMLLDCITPAGWHVLTGWVAFSGRKGFHIAWDISYWFG